MNKKLIYLAITIVLLCAVVLVATLGDRNNQVSDPGQAPTYPTDPPSDPDNNLNGGVMDESGDKDKEQILDFGNLPGAPKK